MKRMLCLLLAVVLLCGMLAACDEEDAVEMTAVPIGTERANEPSETTVPDETIAATEEKKPAPVQTTEATEPAATQATKATMLTQEEVTEPVETETEPEPTVDARTIAFGCIGADVSVLYAVIGYPPNGSSYLPSALGKGEDGMLYYDGFTVCTYREFGTETVVGVS